LARSVSLIAGLTAAGVPSIPIETRHVKAALKAMTMKTDRNTCRGKTASPIELMRQRCGYGWHRRFGVTAEVSGIGTAAYRIDSGRIR